MNRYMVNDKQHNRDPSDHCFFEEWRLALTEAARDPDFAPLLIGPALLHFECNIRGWDMAYLWCLWLKHKLPEYKPPRKNSKQGKLFYLYQKPGEMLLALFHLCAYLHSSPELELEIPFRNAGDWLLEILHELQFQQLVDHLPVPEGCEVIETSDYKAATGGYSTKKPRTLKTPKEKVAASYGSIVDQLKKGNTPGGWAEVYPELTKLIQTFQRIAEDAGDAATATVLWKAFLKAYGAFARDQTRNPLFGEAKVIGNKLTVRDGTSHRRVIAAIAHKPTSKTLVLQGLQPP
ncbi:hypothetical protein [Nodosilinea sp. FACHB-13]|uniref:hypothetical protein n=1 Tax=Cyanophyceae TaxID=3028117 RepID=UPI0016837F5E|nr:hypothetical protein [Nodosilinea sp. FACHB-13]MBD2106709.1 hypothetical protein [Nodosilinea sp. FACHB-13]